MGVMRTEDLQVTEPPMSMPGMLAEEVELDMGMSVVLVAMAMAVEVVVMSITIMMTPCRSRLEGSCQMLDICDRASSYKVGIHALAAMLRDLQGI